MRFYLQYCNMVSCASELDLPCTAGGVYYVEGENLQAVSETLKGFLHQDCEFVRVSTEETAFADREDDLALEWSQPLPEELPAGKVLAIYRFRGETAQAVGKPCFFDGKEAFLLSVERTGKRGCIWYAAAFTPPEIWTVKAPTMRECLLREAEADELLFTDRYPDEVVLNGRSYHSTDMRFFYSCSGHSDPWTEQYVLWLRKRGELPQALEGQNIVFIRISLKEKADWELPIQSLSLRFAPVRRKAFLQRPFLLDLKQPQMELCFEAGGRKHSLSIVEAELESLREALQRLAEKTGQNLEEEIRQISEDERDVVLSCRFSGGNEYLLSIYPKIQLDTPEQSKSFAMGVLRHCEDRSLQCINAGTVTFPAPQVLEMELFSVSWEEPAQEPVTVI